MQPENQDSAQQLEAATVLHSMGRHAEALDHLQRFLSREPNSAQGCRLLGSLLAALNRPQEALAACAKAAELDPASPEPHAVSGRVLAVLERNDEALASYERALALQPTFVPAHYELGMLLAMEGRHEEAVAHFGTATTAWPRYPGTLYSLGNSLMALFRAADALDVYERLRGLDPRSVQAHLGAGNALQALGRLSEARTAYEEALRLAPGIPTLHRAVADLKEFSEGDPQIEVMEALAQNCEQFPVPERVSLHFALFKAYDDLGRYGSAFDYLRQGNALKRGTFVYDEAAVLGHLRDIEAAFTAELMAERRGHGDSSELPVFVLGMPRSGTTLVEQMLASHPRAHGAGELRYLVDLVEEGHAGRDFPADVVSLSDSELRKIGHRYAARLSAHAPCAERIVDKLPANFRYIGLIRMALPKARIIHVRRDPADTCFSCYSKLFVNGLEYTCDLGELGRYYRAYDSLMEHWRRVLPATAMLEVQYEDLVADFEPQARRIVEYCGLEWDDRCLRFHEAERPIFTVSVQQVRKPLFSSSVGRWRHYRKQLRPLLDILGIDEE